MKDLKDFLKESTIEEDFLVYNQGKSLEELSKLIVEFGDFSKELLNNIKNSGDSSNSSKIEQVKQITKDTLNNLVELKATLRK